MQTAKHIPVVIIALYQNDVQSGDKRKPKFDGKIHNKIILRTYYTYHLFCLIMDVDEVSNGAKIKNRYNQVPHLTQDTNGKVTNSQ